MGVKTSFPLPTYMEGYFLERKVDSINGNYFTLPNKIFDEDLTPNEFVVYSFLTKAKDKKRPKLLVSTEHCSLLWYV